MLLQGRRDDGKGGSVVNAWRHHVAGRRTQRRGKVRALGQRAFPRVLGKGVHPEPLRALVAFAARAAVGLPDLGFLLVSILGVVLDAIDVFVPLFAPRNRARKWLLLC